MMTRENSTINGIAITITRVSRAFLPLASHGQIHRTPIQTNSGEEIIRSFQIGRKGSRLTLLIHTPRWAKAHGMHTRKNAESAKPANIPVPFRIATGHFRIVPPTEVMLRMLSATWPVPRNGRVKARYAATMLQVVKLPTPEAAKANTNVP